MHARINGQDLKGIRRMEVELSREVDRHGHVQAHLGTPMIRIEREITASDDAELATLETFADVGSPATVELEFTSNNETIVEVSLTDVIIDRPVIDYRADSLVETIHGRAGTLALVEPEGPEYSRDIPLYPQAS